MLLLINSLAILNRAIKQKQLSTFIANTKLIRNFLKKLVSLGFIKGFCLTPLNKLLVYLRYSPTGITHSSILSIQIISKPGKRFYCGYKLLQKHNATINLNSTSTLILTTPKGLLTAQEALTQNLGGEILCVIT